MVVESRGKSLLQLVLSVWRRLFGVLSLKALLKCVSCRQCCIGGLNSTHRCGVLNRTCWIEMIQKKTMVWIFLGSPLWAFIYCLGVSYGTGKYDGSTITHCGVPNFAMSVSEATSVPYSSKIIWQLAVFAHILPRIYHADAMFKTYIESLPRKNSLDRILELDSGEVEWWISWAYIDWFLASVEWVSLLGLTVVTSHSTVFFVHKTFVAMFLLSSLAHMLTATYQETRLANTFSYQLRRWFSLLTFIGVGLVIYFYQRHNAYCEPYMYSYFCLCEYTVIIINMVYHLLSPPMAPDPKKCCISQRPHKARFSLDAQNDKTLLVV